ncbi:SUKH-4 family immunity protein [Streptomyces rhizosphaerihabitans]|uniref:SUKH-4 family immunity protein n=1 Tax=Streptomyces rhizosphaerihabitans TaxID=1266770 RepID=UPI0021BF1D65|nr:SUKH-4 family immunity protein [Streptomyces rhizosphaerihabitans]MCT9010640.1 SUKH-4 family immunity protein [Streptomyces rhizosphaerihabitans]
MSTTDTDVGGAITLTDDELDPYVTHASTRDRLTGPGLPCDGTLLGFGALREHGLRTVADLAGDADKLAEELRDQLVIGALRSLDRDLESIVLDGTTGEVSSAHVQRNAARLDLSPLAPSLEALLRFAAATEELTVSRGRPGPFGPKAVAEASDRLSAVFEAAGEDVPPYWRMAALIRPLARIAGPGEGLVLGLPKRLLDEEFGAGEIMRFEDVDFPPALTHEPTRRFLRESGLPEDGFLFQLDTEVPLPALTEYYADERPDAFSADLLPAAADRLIRLGYLLEDTSLVVDGTTGAVLAWSEPDLTLRPLNADISTLAFTLWLVHREKTVDAAHGISDSYDRLAATLTETLATVDPTACDRTPTLPGDDGRRYWPEIFEDRAGGTLYA